MSGSGENLFNSFLKIIAALNKYSVEYVVIGGVAMIMHGLPRLTQDLDLVVNLTDTNVDKLREALKSIYKYPVIDEITHEELSKYSVIRYGTPNNFYIDLMARIGESADYHVIEKETKEIEGVKVELATPESMLDLKKNTIRPEDKRDADFLIRLIEARQNGTS